jgi:hypothetical protein
LKFESNSFLFIDEIPNICYAIHAPIGNIPKKEWPKLDEEELSLKDSEYCEDIFTITKNSLNNEIIEDSSSSFTDFKNNAKLDLRPLIHYVLKVPKKIHLQFPELKIENYFEETTNDHITLTFTPNLHWGIHAEVLKLEEFIEFKISCNLSEEQTLKLFSFLGKNIPKANILEDEWEYNIDEIELPEDLSSIDNQTLKNYWDMYTMFNRAVNDFLPCVNYDYEFEDANLFKSQILSKKHMIASSVKNNYLENVLKNIPCDSKQPTVTFDRLKIREKKDKGLVDNDGEWTTFGLAMTVIRREGYNNLKVSSMDDKPWNSKFTTEGSYDDGGPFRDSLSNMVDELHSSWLPLLIPTQNNKHQHGQGQDLWTVNPSAKSVNHLEMFKFLGALMGMWVLSGNSMMMRLPSIFWKNLLGDPIDFEDLEIIDVYEVQTIKEVEKLYQSVKLD